MLGAIPFTIRSRFVKTKGVLQGGAFWLRFSIPRSGRRMTVFFTVTQPSRTYLTHPLNGEAYEWIARNTRSPSMSPPSSQSPSCLHACSQWQACPKCEAASGNRQKKLIASQPARQIGSRQMGRQIANQIDMDRWGQYIQKDRQTDRSIQIHDRKVDRQTDLDKQIGTLGTSDIQVDRQTVQVDRKVSRQIDRQIDGQIDKQKK